MDNGLPDNEISRLIKINQEKRINRKIEDIAMLQQYGIIVPSDGNYPVYIQTEHHRIWYFPETGEWSDRENTVSNFGVTTLIKYLRL